MVKILIQRIGGALVLFVMAWIMTGALIEYHQRYVFDNHADLWELQATHIHGKDLKKLFHLYSTSCYDQHSLYLPGNDHHVNSRVVIYNMNKKTIFSRCLFDLQTPEYITYRSLRGPPVA